MSEIQAQFPLAAEAERARDALKGSYSCEVEPYVLGGWLLRVEVPRGLYMRPGLADTQVLEAVTMNGGKIVHPPT